MSLHIVQNYPWIQTKSDVTFLPNQPGLFPIFPITNRITCSLAHNNDISVKIKTYPIVPGFAITTEKCQGLTLKGAIIGTLRNIDRANPQPNSLYVAPSRATTLKNVRLLEP